MDLEEFELELELDGKSSNTIETYSYYVGKFLSFIDKEAIEEVTAKDVKEFLINLKREEYSKKSMHLVTESLRSYFKEVGRDDILKEIEPPQAPKSLPKALTKKEVSDFMNSIPDHKLRDKTIVRLLYSTGLRVSEIANLEINEIDLDERLLRIEKGKGEKDRIVPMSKEAKNVLEEYLRNRDTGPVFLGNDGNSLNPEKIRYIFRKYSEKSGIKCTPHTLRHTFATHMLEEGTDVRVIQNILGHASLNTTQIYTKVSAKHLKDSYDEVDLVQ